VAIFLVKLCNLTEYHHSLKSPYIIYSQKVLSGFSKMVPFFTSYAYEREHCFVGVPNILLYQQ